MYLCVVYICQGLDPAGPNWDLPGCTNETEICKLDPSDADQVDTILTDARFQGTFNILGHVNFYPNGGVNPQPGCGELKTCMYFMGHFFLGIDKFLGVFFRR